MSPETLKTSIEIMLKDRVDKRVKDGYLDTPLDNKNIQSKKRDKTSTQAHHHLSQSRKVILFGRFLTEGTENPFTTLGQENYSILIYFGGTSQWKKPTQS